MENSVEVSQKVKNRNTTRSTSGSLPPKNQKHRFKKTHAPLCLPHHYLQQKIWMHSTCPLIKMIWCINTHTPTEQCYWAIKKKMKTLIYFFKKFFNVYFWERKRVSKGWAERKEDTEFEAGSRLWVVSIQPDVGLEPTNRETMTWAEVRCLTDWATQVLPKTLNRHMHSCIHCSIIYDSQDMEPA